MAVVCSRCAWMSLLLCGCLLLATLPACINGFSEDFYNSSCPNVSSIVKSKVADFLNADINLAGGFLRLHFHDCWVQGCEGSVLLNSTRTNPAERDAPSNFKLRGIPEIDQIKEALEAQCPGVVSCADIVALAARDAAQMVAGPNWRVPLGRRDGLSSTIEGADHNLPFPNLDFSGLVANFAAKGFTQNEMILLSGAHTIGRAHCNGIQPHLYNFTGVTDLTDPTLDADFAAKLKKTCPKGNRENVVDMDSTINIFDRSYFQTVLANKGVFSTDTALITDASGRKEVERLAQSNSTFLSEFAAAMEKLGTLSVLTGSQGEIRKRCQFVN